jgi:hypothetical protein
MDKIQKPSGSVSFVQLTLMYYQLFVTGQETITVWI